MGNKTDEIVLAECSDDEEYTKLGCINKENSCWAPKLEEVDTLYQQIKTNKLVELLWKCPGKRDSSKSEPSESEPESTPSSSQSKDLESKDFDFDIDEDLTPAMLKHTVKPGANFKSKANPKRTTTLAGILSNMERHRIIERMDGTTTGGGEKPPLPPPSE